MSAVSSPESAPEAAKPPALVLVLPDWQRIDTVLRSPLPFVLWTVGDQPLLYHWLDHAVDRGFERVILVCADRPAEVRRAMEEQAQLWPLAWEIETVPAAQQRPDAVTLDHLPEGAPSGEAPQDGWALLEYWFALRKQWFAQMTLDGDESASLKALAIGRFCSIHPTAELRMPVWIEDYVQIGPGSVIGPNVSLGRGVMIEGLTEICDSVVAPYTYLAGHTELRDCFLEGGLLLNLRHKARVAGIDMVIASSLKDDETAPTVGERLFAFFLWLAFWATELFAPKSELATWECFDGSTFIERKSAPLWRRRGRWLPRVFAGDLALFGVLPRTRAQLESLDEEWREIIQRAPRGVFAYSDLYGVHSADDELESVHAVYQATQPAATMRGVMRTAKWKLLGAS